MNRTTILPRPPSQERLAELLEARATWAGTTVAEAAETAETTVLVLLRAVDMTDLVDGARTFAAGLTDDEADAWRRSWTRTRFLFGNPGNVARRTPARVVAPGESAAWLGPFPSTRLPGMSRLLKPVSGVLPKMPSALTFPPTDRDAGNRPGYGDHRELQVAVRDLTLAEYLVHLHHTLAESVLLGLLRPEEPLRLVHRMDFDARTAEETPAYARVHFGHDDPTTLRLFTWLSSPAQR